MTMRWKGSIINKLHIELSNHCNAACPFCPRFLDATRTVRDDLVLTSITAEQYKSWLQPKHLEDMKRILFCGTHGDPIMAKDFNDIIEYTIESNPDIHNIIHTNGGARNVAFWTRLGEMSKKMDIPSIGRSNIQLIFSIDGLEDTNHLYRRNVNWDKLMENVKAFLAAGGCAVWEFLVFKHNEHQVEEARKLSEEMGFMEFRPKRPLGFESNNGLKVRAVYDREGKLENKLYPSLNYKNHSDDISDVTINERYEPEIDVKKRQQDKIKWMKERLDSFEDENTMYLQNIDKLNNMKVKCKSMEMKHGVLGTEIYISANGTVFPCCYVGTRVDSNIDMFEDVQMRAHMRDEGMDKFRLTKYSLDEIIGMGSLDNVFAESWDKKSVQCGKLAYCAQICGSDSEIDRIYKAGDKNS